MMASTNNRQAGSLVKFIVLDGGSLAFLAPIFRTWGQWLVPVRAVGSAAMPCLVAVQSVRSAFLRWRLVPVGRFALAVPVSASGRGLTEGRDLVAVGEFLLEGRYHPFH